MPGLSAFSDDIRDGMKGSVFEDESTGFVSGAKGVEESVKFGVVGAIGHDQVDYDAVNYSDSAWTTAPWQAISYVSCHDNHTLFDKLTISAPEATDEEIVAMHKLANAVVLTTQGIPFLHAGVEMMRTKGGEHNSYNKPDSVNRIDWQWKVDHHGVFDYYRKLITLRKAHPAFAMPDADMVRQHLRFLPSETGTIVFSINGAAMNDSWKEILVCYNAHKKARKLSLEGAWNVAVQGDHFLPKEMPRVSRVVKVPGLSMLILYRD
jgi:pullulanase